MEAKEIAQYADRCMFCVSEDFGAPIGSLVCGSKEFIYELRQTRRLLGGDLRQGGGAAVPAIYARRFRAWTRPAFVGCSIWEFLKRTAVRTIQIFKTVDCEMTQ